MNNLNPPIAEADLSRLRQEFFQKVYAWMFGGLLITAVTAWFFATSDLVWSLAEHRALLILLFVAEIGLVIYISGRINTLTFKSACLAFLLYSFLNGITFSSIFLVYVSLSIQQTFLTAAAMFATLSVYGYLTKKELSGFGQFLYMGLFGLIFAGLINLFLGSYALTFAISVIGVLLFAGLTVYDTQKLKEMWQSSLGNEQLTSNLAIFGALQLYLDFINLFLFLLRFLGERK